MHKTIANKAQDCALEHHAIPFKQQLVFLIFLVFYFVRFFVAPMSLWDWVVNLGVLALFLPGYFLAFRYSKLVVPIGLFFIALSLLVAPFNWGANCFAIFACNFFAYSQPARRALGLILATVATLAVSAWLLDYHPVYFLLIGVIASLGSGLSAIFDRQRLTNIARKNRSLDEVQRLAQIAERERIGQDLHDLLGHTLTVVNLKAQLAHHLLDNGQTERARQALQTIESVAQKAVKEVRQAVTGYKTHSLQQELNDQRHYFAAMGIALVVDREDWLLPPAMESQLIMMVREALNNVLKHAEAKQCRITFNRDAQHLYLLIEDNGRGIKQLGQLNDGNGIGGIRQRAEALGGHLAIEHRDGFALVITLPWNKDYDEHYDNQSNLDDQVALS